MQTMRRCIIRYGWRPAGNWSSQIWDALKYEVLNATEDELADEALSVLQTLSGCLSLEETTLQTLENTVLYKYISAIVKECVKHFKEPQQKYAKEAGKIVGKVASGSAHSFHLVVKEVFPTLLTILQDTPALTKKRELLEVFNKVLDARLDLAEKDEGKSSETLDTIIDTFQVTSLVDKSAYEGLTLFRDNLFEIFTLNLSSPPKEEVALRTSAARGLLRLVKIPKFLTPNEVGMIIQHLNIVILDREDSGLDLRDESIRSLQEVAKLYPQDVADITFPALLGTLPDVADADGVMTHLPVLEALSKIASANCEANVLFEILVRRLTRKFEDVIRQGESQFYARMILVGLLYGFGQLELACKKLSSPEQTLAKKRIHDQNGYVIKYLCQFLTVSGYNITADGERHYIGLRSLETAKGSEFADDHLLEVIGKICMTVIRFMDVKDQHSVGLEVFNLFAEIPPKVSKTVVRENQLDFLNSTKDQQRTLILSMYLLAGLNRKVRVPNI
jgi:DNA repair/transcription protein MET18/MMS19